MPAAKIRTLQRDQEFGLSNYAYIESFYFDVHGGSFDGRIAIIRP